MSFLPSLWTDRLLRLPPRSAPIARRRAFTLIELLVVISIIGILAGMLLVSISHAQWAARLAYCKNNIHEFALGVKEYSNEWDSELPPWLSNLYPQYVTTLKLYICPADVSEPKGSQGGKPPWQTGGSSERYQETWDFKGSPASGIDAAAAALQNPDVLGNSYLYEFCCAQCNHSWATSDGPNPTWRKEKEAEALIWPHVPMISCWWHTNGTFGQKDVVLRVGYLTHQIYTSDTKADGWKTEGAQ